MIQLVQPISKEYDLDNGQPYNVKTGKDADIYLKSFAEILRKEIEKGEISSNHIKA